jgi:Rieske Fe-S protein
MRKIPVQSASKLPRRRFVALCASTLAAAGATPDMLARAASAPVRMYERVRLTGGDGDTLRAGALLPGKSYVFNYPYVTTPCFLLDLGRALEQTVELRTEAGDPYLWAGGVGPRRSLVSFSAICAHKMSHPAKTVSFINYRHEAVSYRDHSRRLVKQEGVILCCSEKSVYDPARGAAVLGGPAKQPLCTILIEHDPVEDALYALGSNGGEMFDRFFGAFGARLQLEWRRSDVRAPVRGSTAVVPMDEYSQTQMLCGG